ncbi:UDP-N-acetylmuramate dehydrogenase [uncultured Ferrovibrio sp.]|jgi:UDP-N-acetylmuramate dehydrogenase|uniref:UDP-N-acetylmuramate dehydrogenase n=1 Tax=uncultured Ferrovibrio sp. TaxID=1576913 RepID=UPI0026376174|nr:UDP-N-acetylmuramate dehydrogenase [uncultured Ferrovibrio sp.]
MMAAVQLRQNDLIARLPQVRGRLTAAAPLADITWFRVGGPAEVMFRPADRDDLIAFLKAKPADVAVTPLGVGSNTLVRDGGVPGVVLRLGREFAAISADGTEVEAGAGALDVNVATVALQAGIAGLEFLRGIPGTIGGGLRMNAGAYGTEFKDVLVWAEAVDPQGNLHRLTPDEMKFGYRHCGVPENWIFIGARLKGVLGDPAAIKARMDEIQAAREGSQPIRSRTGGSTFANPEGLKAWQLIDAAGCRGLVVGDAQVSEQHCNFLINRGNATAEDLERLGETVRERVKAQSGIELRWEIKRIGLTKETAHG